MSGLPRANRSRTPSEQHAQPVLRLLDSPLRIDDGAACRVDELFRLPHVHERRGAAALPNLGQPQRLFARRQRPLRNLELEVEGAKIVVEGSNLADECRGDGAPSPLAGGDLCARGLAGAAELAPEVELPREGAAQLHQARERQPLAVDDRPLRALHVRLAGHRRISVGASNSVLRRCLLDARRGNPQVVVLLERRIDQLPQDLIVEYGRPCLVADGHGVRSGCTAAEFTRRDDRRPLVVRPGDAGRGRGDCRQHHERAKRK